METVFVYGSLMEGYGNHLCLERHSATFLGCAESDTLFELLDFGPYPGCTKRGQGTRVRGEVYRVDSDCFLTLDNLEGYPAFYTRTQEPVTLDGETVTAWIYHLKKVSRTMGGKVVESGNWRDVAPRRVNRWA